jgi:hypothetical protein
MWPWPPGRIRCVITNRNSPAAWRPRSGNGSPLERAGENVRRIGSGVGYEGARPARTGPRCASVHGFSLHANTDSPAHRRDQLERVMRSTGRGAVSLERLAQDANGDLMYRFTRPWPDGTTGMKLSPLELLEKLAASVPLPRAHLVRYGGCLAPPSTLRAALIPTPRQQGSDGDASKTGTPDWHWARLLGRVCNVAMGTCPFCRRGSRRMLAAITQESVITRLWRHLQLASVPPPIAPARLRQEIFACDAAQLSGNRPSRGRRPSNPLKCHAPPS